jgi:hypothetical protein
MPFLIVLSPDAERGRRIDIGHDMVVGRGDRCDIRFDDPFVSRTHAGLRCHGRSVWVQDLGSAGGTFVNGVPAQTEHELRPGDVLALADIRLQYDDESPIHVPPAPRYDIGSQRDGVFHNVAGNQYIVQQRESFMRSVAARKSKARWLIVLGFVLLIAGTGFAALTMGAFLKTFDDAWSSAAAPSSSPFSGTTFGLPTVLFGALADAAGLFMIIAGIVLHVVATARARDVDREFPMPYQG